MTEITTLTEAGRPIARVLVAATRWTRLRGLLGRTGLGEEEGLWIRPCSGVHTLFMRFAIDVVALDAGQRIVRIWPRLRPWRLTSVRLEVVSVLELRAGRAEACGLQAGDQLCLIETC